VSAPRLDRGAIRFKPLAERRNKLLFPRDAVPADAVPRALSAELSAAVSEAAGKVRAARARGRPVMCAFGAHTIKNGLGPVLIALMKDGWLTHLATNGAGIIHDWEISYQGRTSEDVRENVSRGEFGTWEETGAWINLALLVGAYRGLGYGESVGALIADEGLTVPGAGELAAAAAAAREDPERAGAAADILAAMAAARVPQGCAALRHPFRDLSVQAAARTLGIPFTGHPMFGHDIIYTHPMNSGPAVGRTALRDFLTYAEAVRGLEGGVYLSVGSAVMSPMIFEKALSMARNLEQQAGRRIDGFSIFVVDLARSTWDWTRDGEPPQDDPAYYLRYCKTFSRMGGSMRYICADNRDFFTALRWQLQG
jgi:hypothetical protein